MKYYQDGQKYIVVLKKGEDLMEGLGQFCKGAGVSEAWLQGLGAALSVELGYYHLDEQEYKWRKFDGPLEITGLNGNIVQKDGQPVFHIHASLSGPDYGAIGGHVKSLTVAGTCEMLVHKTDTKLTRTHDEQVGLDLLSPAS